MWWQLGCTDAAPRPVHSRPMRRRGREAADRASVPRRATWQVPNRADAAEIGVDAAQIGLTRSVLAISVCIGRNGRVRPKFKKKKKKRVQTHRLTNLNNPDPSQTLTLRPKLPKILSHSVPHLPSLCVLSLISLLCVSSSLWVLCAHCTASAFRCALSTLFFNFYSLFFTISLFQIA